MHPFFWNLYASLYDTLSRLSIYRSLVEEIYNSLDVELDKVYLDAGCGAGNLLLKIAREGKARAYGVDFSMLMIKQAMRKCRNENVTLLCFDLNKRLPFKDEFFDGIACVHTLYSLRNPTFTLKEFHRVLKKGSELVLVDPRDGGSTKSCIDREYLQADGLFYLSHFPSCLALALMNTLLFAKVNLKRISFLPEETLDSLLRQVPFTVTRTKSVYEDTSVLIVARK